MFLGGVWRVVVVRVAIEVGGLDLIHLQSLSCFYVLHFYIFRFLARFVGIACVAMKKQCSQSFSILI